MTLLLVILPISANWRRVVRVALRLAIARWARLATATAFVADSAIVLVDALDAAVRVVHHLGRPAAITAIAAALVAAAVVLLCEDRR